MDLYSLKLDLVLAKGAVGNRLMSLSTYLAFQRQQKSGLKLDVFGSASFHFRQQNLGMLWHFNKSLQVFSLSFFFSSSLNPIDCRDSRRTRVGRHLSLWLSRRTFPRVRLPH